MYNDTDQTFFNVSTTAFTRSGFAVGGAAHFVESFGPQGLLVVIGGQTAASPTAAATSLSLDTVYLFDPMSRTWQEQAASGSPPTAVLSPCLVGVEGDNGTYEVRLRDSHEMRHR